jgi:hypothetical protein
LKLSYFDLISPTSYKIDGVGGIRAVTARDVDSLPAKNQTYQMYLQVLLIGKSDYYKLSELDSSEIEKLEGEFKKKNERDLTLFDIYVGDSQLLDQIVMALNFFIDEEVAFDTQNLRFITYTEDSEREGGEINATGYITLDNYAAVYDTILQRNGVKYKEESQPEEVKFKNKSAEKLYKRMQAENAKKAARTKKRDDAKMELGNIMSALSAMDESISMLNIWDMTIYNIYDQFERRRLNTAFNLRALNVSVWGDSDNTFDIEQWFDNRTQA